LVAAALVLVALMVPQQQTALTAMILYLAQSHLVAVAVAESIQLPLIQHQTVVLAVVVVATTIREELGQAV
jgi:hypothetical protein